MNHIAVRRFALTAASVSFSILTALVLLVSAAYGGEIADGETEPPVVNDKIDFPFPISCTSAVVESVASYDGPFFEDGSGREVFNTSAIVLRNTGNEMIPYIHVIMRTGSTSYIFEGFWIPAGASVLIPEKFALPFTHEDSFISCFGWATVLQQGTVNEISVEEMSMGEVCITNLSDAPIRSLTLYHKTYMQDSNLFIGGVAFQSRVDCLGSGETIIISPEYYASGYSKIIYYE